MADLTQIQLPDDNTYNIKDANVPHSSLTAASGGTDLSLVTTGEKYAYEQAKNTVKQNGIDAITTTDTNSYQILFSRGVVDAEGEVYKMRGGTLTFTPYNTASDGPLLNMASSIGVCNIRTDVIKARRTLYVGDSNTNTEIKLPYTYGSEQFVGYFETTMSGAATMRPVFEKTVELSSAKTIAAGNSSAAGAWTSVSTGWNDTIIVLDFQAYSYSGNDKTYWGHLTAQWNRTNKDIRVLNIRSQTFPIDAFTIRYFYAP
jgi:hypothetical protein